MRRFWTTAASTPLAAGFGLLLDGKAQLTPAGHDYLCPTKALAAALWAEWQTAPEQFDPRQMPITQLVATTQDITVPRRAEIITQLMAHAGADMLCFRAAHPPPLVALQHEVWQPYLDWALARFDALLKFTDALQPVAQDAQAIGALGHAMAKLDMFRLTALRNAADVTGSVVLALALIEGWQPTAVILAAAELDAAFQRSRWGDDEAARMRHNAIQDELATLARFVALL